MAGADAVGHIAQDSGDDGAAADGGDEERRAALGVAAQAAQGQREDGREDAALEEEHQHQHRETPQFAFLPWPVSVPMAALMNTMIRVWYASRMYRGFVTYISPAAEKRPMAKSAWAMA